RALQPLHLGLKSVEAFHPALALLLSGGRHFLMAGQGGPGPAPVVSPGAGGGGGGRQAVLRPAAGGSRRSRHKNRENVWRGGSVRRGHTSQVGVQVMMRLAEGGKALPVALDDACTV